MPKGAHKKKTGRCRDCGVVRGHSKDCPRLRTAEQAYGTSVLPNGKQCPVCRRLLAAGAWCPDHGDPLPNRERICEPLVLNPFED